MLEGQDIICIAPNRWDSPLRRRQQVMWRLSSRNRVVYVSFDLGRWRDNMLARARWLVAYPPETRKHASQLFELPLFNILPTRFTARYLARKINGALTAPVLDRLGRQLRGSCPILWYTFPILPAACLHFEPRLIVYDRSDHWPDHYSKDERMLLKRADVVFATARSLLESAEHLNSNVHLVPNGVDVKSFRRALLPETSIPLDVAGLPKPIVGLMGAINAKIDTSLLTRLAQAHPAWSIVLVGPVIPSEIPTRTLQNLPNVHMLGYREPSCLPEYLKGFDVAVIPYVLNERTRAINPLKAYEYLAAGRPVVATALPELRGFGSVVRIARGRNDFVTQVELALQEDDPELAHRRFAAVQNDTWDQRVATMEHLIGTTTQAL